MGDLLIIKGKQFNTIAINVNTIVYIEETKDGCSIYLNDGSGVDCTHSFSEVIGAFHSPYPYDSNKNVFIQKNIVN